ncbi:hypothetical protein OHD23_26590 [Escherichia coli]|nr:hypothetical protein [Escherichia coli]
MRKQNRFSRASEKMFDRIIAAYGRGLAKVLKSSVADLKRGTQHAAA